MSVSLLFITALGLAPAERMTANPLSTGLRTASEIVPATDKLVPVLLKKHDVPAVSIAFIENGKVAWTRAYGEQSQGVPATPATLFNVASLTKPLTAELILRLASRGKLSLDEPMWPAWVDPDLKNDARHRRLTPLIALTHRTGFSNWRPDDGPLVLQWEPGSKTGYSGEGFNYLGRFAEKKTGRSFEQLMHSEVLGPLKLKNMFFTSRLAMTGRVAVVQGPDGTRRLPDVQFRWNGADDLHATAGDYAQFVAAVMKGRGLHRGIAARRSKTFENLVTMACPPEKIRPDLCPRSVAFGLGWVVFDNGKEVVMTHGGGDWGERTLAFYVPSRKSGAVIFTSGANGQKAIRDIVASLYPMNAEFNAFLGMQAAS
jgi:CubicO group peptidase (beta-lactamase class C family)